MTVEFDLTADDLEVLRQRLLSKWQSKRTYRKIYSAVLVLGLFPLGVIAVMLVGGRAPAASYLMLVLPAAMFAGLWTYFYKLLVLPAMTSTFANANAHLVGHHTVLVNEDGVRDAGPVGESFHKWSAVEEIHDDAAHIFVGVVGRQYYTVPKRSLAQAAEPGALVARMNDLRTAAYAPTPPNDQMQRTAPGESQRRR